MAQGHRPGSASWWQGWHAGRARPRRPRPDGLTLERVLAGALAVVDAEGLDALTMRRLAEELGCAHTSLYRHVAGREELLVLVVDSVLGELGFDDVDVTDPRRLAELLLHRYRTLLLAHPALAPVFTRGQLLGPNALRAREVGLRLLMDAGASPELAAEAYLTLTHHVIGSAVLEAGGAARTASERAAMAELFAELDPDEHPTLVALGETISTVEPEREFAFGLRVLVDGIEARIRAEQE